MPREYCPVCGQVRNMSVTVGEHTRTDAEGKKQKVLTTVYHCEACWRFIRSEESVQGGQGK
jgi:C4-type Zn-finger protein